MVKTITLLKLKGWEIQLGTSNSWELDIFSIDSDLDRNNLEITKANLSGPGTINLGENLRLEKLLINGVYEVNVSKNLPIVVSGNAETPSSWINASIGTLNNVNESYRLLVEIVDGSEVIFNDEWKRFMIDQIGNGLLLGIIISVASVALSLLYSVTRSVNFAHGEIID